MPTTPATSTKSKNKSKDMVMGSGRLYAALVTSSNSTIPTLSTLVTADNNVGHIKSGFTCSYTVDTVTEEDDLGEVSKTVITKKTSTAKCGLVTWNGTTVKKFVKGTTVSEDTTAHTRTTDIGGNTTDDDEYWFAFVPEDTDRIDGIIFKGSPVGGWNAVFESGTSSKLEPEIAVVPFDENGNRFRLIENDETITAPQGD